METGTLLLNRYRITDTLGKGGMGAVYRAVDDSLGVQVAVKENLFTDEDYARQFRREAVILANMRHPNLPRVTDHFTIDGQGQYLVMDFIEGEDLRQRMDRLGVLPENEVALVGAAMCDALTYLHTLSPPVLHRDIKPGNIKITPNGQVMLVDFGLAKIVRGSQATTTGARGLTPGYSPPEQYGSARTDHRSDIYALAATLYAALTGTPPEDGLARAMAQSSLTRVRDHNPKINDSVAIAIERALEVQPDDRFQTAGEFKDALLATGESATIIQGAPAGGMIVTPPPTEFVDQADRLVEEMEDSFRSGVQSTISDTVSTPEPKTRRGWLSCVLALGAVGIIGVVGFGLAYLLAPDFLSTFIGTQSTDVVATDVVAQVPSQTVTLAPPTATLVPLPTNTEMAVIPADTLAPTDTPYPTETPTLAATPMGGGGQIAFASDRVGGLPQIWMVNLDGSNPTQVTDIRDGACQPDWSPEGTRLVFISPCAGNKVTYNGSALFLVNADGSGLVPLPSAPGGDFDPDWSPDGEKIAFTSVRDNNRPQIWVFDLASNQASTLSNSKSSDFQPDWSPDGTKIVFVTTRTGATQLWYMDASGRPWDEFSRSNDFVNTHPIWSPTGDFIMFIQNTQSGRIPWFQVAYWEDGGPQRGFREFTVNEDYLAPRRDPGYSPDGFWIVFESNPEGPNHDIFIMTANGTGVQQVTTDPANDFDPAWRPMRPHP